MSQARLVLPIYADRFRCIGSACEDTCCHGWSVPIEKAAYDKFQTLPPSPLRTLIDASILLAPKDAKSSDGYGSELFAKLRMTESNTCPMLTADHLCQVHAQLGEGYLANICATYPRIVHPVAGVEEKALALSCPEAVRVALLEPLIWKAVDAEAAADSHDDEGESLPPFYWPIRAAVLEVARNRAYPLWQRLLLLGILCHRLDELVTSHAEQTIPAYLSGFSDSVMSGHMRPALEAQPIEPQAHMDAVLRLAGLMLNKSNVTSRFVECIQAFTTGIGNGPQATLASLTDGFIAAHEQYFVPFITRYPHILENYIVNTILRMRFPFGREGMKAGAVVSMQQEFTKLIAQFALMKGLLVGVSGFHGESFSTAHVVHTVQAASKHFDHHPDFPKLAFELLVECRLDGIRGASILVRQLEPASPQITPERELPLPAPGYDGIRNENGARALRS